MKYFFSLALLITLLFACTEASNTPENSVQESVTDETSSNQKQLRHVVLFKFKDSTSTENIASVEAAFAALPAKIPQIRVFEWGTNNSPEGLEKGFTHCFFLTFDSEEDRAIYLPHPDHKAFGNLLSPYLDDVLVVDYWTNE